MVKYNIMKILVTGGAGFIGSHIVDAYISLGHEVVVIDNLSTGEEKFINKKAVFYKQDIRDRQAIEKIIKEEKPQVINHHAAQISVRESVADPIHDAQVNIVGLLNILETARKYKIKKIIFASSGGVVYGEAKTIPTPESYTPLIPLSPYAVSKLASEYYLDIYYKTYKIPYICLRYGNIYGPRQNPHGEAGVVAIFTLKLLKGEKPVINGDGRQTRDYVYVNDVVQANIIALGTSRVGSFNIGTRRQTDVVTIYNYLKKITQSSISVSYGPPKAGEQRLSCLDNKQARKILAWQTRVSLKKGLEKTVEYFRRLNLG